MLLGDILQRVQSLYSKGVQSDDTRLVNRHIYSAVTTARNVLLRQKADKGQIISDWSYQTLPCAELEKAPLHECPCVPVPGCIILRTKHKIPKPITNLDSHMIKTVMTIDGSITFDETTYEDEKYSKGNKFTSKIPKWFPHNERVYITIVKQLKAVAIKGLYDDFVAAKLFPSICVNECPDCCEDVLDMEFPLEGDSIRPLIQLANEELIIIMKQLTEDRLSNSQDDDMPTGMVHQPNPARR